MQDFRPIIALSKRFVSKTSLGLLLMFWIAGCGVTTGSHTAPSTTVQPGPQNYFAPYVAGNSNSAGAPLFVPQTYTLDDKIDTFSQTTYLLQPTQQVYSQVMNAGGFTVDRRGLRSLGITVTYVVSENGSPAYIPQIISPPKTGSFAMELAGQTGGLMQLVGQPVAPLVAATQCPSLKTAQTYLFVSIPGALAFISPGQPQLRYTWDPTTDTAYGSVDITSSGSTITFQNIHQFKLPPVGETGVPPLQPVTSSQTGVCGPTSYGNITNVPGQLIVTNPGNAQTAPPQAKIGIGASSGLLVEDNGAAEATGSLPGTSPPLLYNNILGAGTGAVGLPKPSSALDTSAVVGAQYLGFIYSAGTSGTSALAFSSHLASFGFPSLPSTCPSLPPSTTRIYGGDFPNDDPSTSPDGFGNNCNFAIDLGPEDPSTNGLYSQATVRVGNGYATNSTSTTYSSFPAVAIAGQLNGKYAIFLIGFDSTQPWAIYLLQSN